MQRTLSISDLAATKAVAVKAGIEIAAAAASPMRAEPKSTSTKPIWAH